MTTTPTSRSRAARLALPLLPLMLGACVSTAHIEPVPQPQRPQAISQAAGLERDRQAILAMVGDYQVTFNFAEHDPAPGYQASPAYRSGAYEMVLVAEATPERIVLQHMLVHRAAGFVVKHWRQDWVHEAASRLEFTEDQTWRKRPLDPSATRGTWTQCVYEVSDAPRYCGTGRWTYDGGVPSWTSDLGARPLPRREYSKRSDYNALAIVNTHRITADGWQHAQENRKVVRQGQREVSTLVQEAGLNDYRRIKGFNFGTGYRYWEDSAAYWKRIRAEWNRRIDEGQGVRLQYPVDGMDMIWAMYRQSEQARNGVAISDAEIRKLFDPWVTAP